MIRLPQTLPVNKTSFIALLVFGLLIAGVGLLDTKAKYVNAGLGLLCCVYAAVSMRLSMSYLQIDEDGMTIKIAFRPPRRVNFADVSPYGFTVVGGRDFRGRVMWRYKLGAGPRPVFRFLDFLHDALPYQDRLPFNYAGRSPQRMCELLNIAFTQKQHG